MMTATLIALVDKYDLKGQTLGDVTLGAVLKHSDDWNLARECAIGSGLSPRTPGVDVQRACGTSLEACIQIANKISLGQIESGIAGGTDTTSDELITWCKERLAAYKYPRIVEFSESLPKGPTGKILKRELK